MDSFGYQVVDFLSEDTNGVKVSVIEAGLSGYP